MYFWIKVCTTYTALNRTNTAALSISLATLAHLQQACVNNRSTIGHSSCAKSHASFNVKPLWSRLVCKKTSLVRRSPFNSSNSDNEYFAPCSTRSFLGHSTSNIILSAQPGVSVFLKEDSFSFMAVVSCDLAILCFWVVFWWPRSKEMWTSVRFSRGTLC